MDASQTLTLRREGVTPREALEKDVHRLHIQKFSAATSLKDMAEEYVYFTHGLLFTHAYWKRDPVVDHIVEQKGDSHPFHIQLPYPVFRWFDAKDAHGNVIDDQWNRQIVAIPKDQWEPLFRFFCQSTGQDNNTKTVYLVAVQKIPIVDTLALARMTSLPEVIPMVDCFCLALMGNRRTVYFAPEHRKAPHEPVPVMIGRADAKAIRFGRAIFRGDEKPHAGTLEYTMSQAAAIVAAGPNHAEAVKAAVANPKALGITDAELLKNLSLENDPLAIRVVNNG